jgi:hypothetical protein
MDDHQIAVATLIVAVLALQIAVVGVWYAAKTLKDGIRVSRAQFFATVRGLMSDYDDVHAKLRPGGDWASKVRAGPQNAAEWARVELYMGLFEYCERLLEQGLLNQTDFDRNLRYRLINIVANPIIVQRKLHPPLAQHWGDFMRLCVRSTFHRIRTRRRRRSTLRCAVHPPA